MIKTGKKDVGFVLGRLEEMLKAGAPVKKVNSISADINKTIERSSSMISNKKLLNHIQIYAGAMVATCNLSIKNEKKVDAVLMVGMLTLMLAKMERDGIIKINV